MRWNFKNDKLVPLRRKARHTFISDIFFRKEMKYDYHICSDMKGRRKSHKLGIFFVNVGRWLILPIYPFFSEIAWLESDIFFRSSSPCYSQEVLKTPSYIKILVNINKLSDSPQNMIIKNYQKQDTDTF